MTSAENQSDNPSSEEPQQTIFQSSSPSTPVNDPGQDLSGMALGEFRLLRRLGKGGMANVYLAQQTSLNRHVAVKVLKTDMVADNTYLERFKAEAMAAANLNHVNIVQVYTIGEAEGYHYIAQEYVQGMNLKDFISRKGPPELSVALHIMRQIALALQKAGEAGIVHRDIKPENILINRKGVVKIADFGLAQLTLDGERMNLTQEGVTMGTPLYMSPEQVKGNKVDQRSDIYSFGVTCYHMLAGRPPFRGQTAIAIAMKHVNSQPAALSKRRPDLPDRLCRVVHRMMNKNVKERHQDVGEVLQEIRKIMRNVQDDQEDVSLSNFATSGSSQEIPEKSGRGAGNSSSAINWKKYLLLSLLLFVVGGFAGFLSRPRLSGTPPLNATERNGPREQFADAMLNEDNEDAWKALRNKYPTSEERWRAEERLAILYLREGRFDEASQIFENFIAQAGDDKFNLVPVGFAGRAVIAALKGDYARSDQILAENSERITERLDGPMVPLVRETIEQNMKALENPRMPLDKAFPEEIEDAATNS